MNITCFFRTFGLLLWFAVECLFCENTYLYNIVVHRNIFKIWLETIKSPFSSRTIASRECASRVGGTIDGLLTNFVLNF